MILLLFFLALALERPYHRVTVAQLATTTHTHVEVHGVVAMVRKEADGDWHLRITDGRASIVAEIIPAIPLPVPTLNDRVRLWGISRIDRTHRWGEVHPVERLEIQR